MRLLKNMPDEKSKYDIVEIQKIAEDALNNF